MPSSTLSYNTSCSSSKVRVEKAFSSTEDLFIGRTAARTSASQGAGVIVGSACGTDSSEVRMRAFAELVERVSAFESAHDRTVEVISASTNGLVEDGLKVIPPSSLQHFGALQELPAYIDRTPDDRTRTWCSGFNLSNGDKTYLPALSCFFKWWPPAGETLFTWPSATGLAAARKRELALRHALLEVIERDACMLSWRIPYYPVISLDQDIVSPQLRKACTNLDLIFEPYGVETKGLPGTIIVLLFGESLVKLTCGSACGGFDQLTANRALCEALTLQWTMRNCPKHAGFLVPRDSYSHVEHAYNRGSVVVEWYRSKSQPLKGIEGTSAINLTQLIDNATESFNSPVLAVDVTSRNARLSGWFVFRVIIPGALPRESDFLVAHLGGARIDAFNPSMLNLAPHPFG